MIEHQEFKQIYNKSNSMYYIPESPDLKLWKYMSFDKFMAVLTSKTLWFSHIKQFSDPREGYFHLNNFQNKWIIPLSDSGVFDDPIEVDEIINEKHIDITNFKLERMKTIKTNIERTYINCWNISEHDSELMWLAYGGSLNSVAFVTKYEKLLNAFVNSKSQMHFEARRVNYVDLNEHKISLADRFSPLFIKQRRYKDENEMRITVHNYRLHGDDDNVLSDYGDVGLNIEIEIKDAIDYIAINPNSSRWFIDTVMRVCEREDILFNVLEG